MENTGSNKPINKLLPLYLSIAIVIGIWLGSKLAPPGNQPIIFPSKAFNDVNKINEILNYISDAYVDTINKGQLVESSIEELLQSLDPHSYYIPAKDFDRVTDPLEGNLDGIGVEFRMIKDTVVVIQTIPGGPSEQGGILAGDRIVKVNDSIIAGKKLENQKVIGLLKGKKGTSVSISIFRKGESQLLPFTIKRSTVPIKSVSSAYMLDNQAGFIKIERFGKTTYEEFLKAADALMDNGMKYLILDLRNNGGGYLNAATSIADEILPDKELIVYTEGRSRPRQTVYGTKGGLLSETKLYVLINEYSASASEILAGAIQDNDRGIIVGRRSFGKGLVQEQIDLPDGSAVRLTVARYYTPTGRSIQKPYDTDPGAYHKEAFKRYANGELQYADSIKILDSLKYQTAKGKILYGGGGITPDEFISIDTTLYTAFLSAMQNQGVFQEVGFSYADNHRNLITLYSGVEDFNKRFELSSLELQELNAIAKSKNIKIDFKELKSKNEWIKNRIKAEIALNIWGSPAYIYITNNYDRMVQATQTLMKSN